MIKVTTMNQQAFYLNCDLIYRIESAPDTVITLVDSKTIMVLETPEVIVERMVAYHRRIYQATPADLISQEVEFKE